MKQILDALVFGVLMSLATLAGCSSAPRETGLTILSPPPPPPPPPPPSVAR